MFPWAFYQRGKKKRLSDIEFLAKKEFDSKLRQNDVAAKTSTGDGATLTANTGKDMYLAKAKVTMQDTSVAFAGTVTVVLKINTVTVSTTHAGGTGTGQETIVYEFATAGFKVAAGEIIKIETTALSNFKVSSELICFEEDTGDTPVI